MLARHALAVASVVIASLIPAPGAWAQAPATPAAPAKSRAPARSTIHDFVMLKDGTSINGDVKVVTFTLKTKYGTLTIPKADILAIEYRKPPNKLEDEVQISAGTRLRGDLQPAVIK